MYDITLELSATTQDMAAKTRDLVATTNELRDHIADFDDFFRPIRNYFYWEPHCFDIPICWSLRSIFDSIDGIDATADKIGALQVDIDKLASLTPQLAALIPPIIDTMKTTKALTLSPAQHVRGDARPDGVDERHRAGDGPELRPGEER